mmetsp:Transcript_93570/g.270330  ORF Transcript_93570/g.270330 Transcript_93570/m.270330 type:complete len:665 (-) Transcript_93570:166-2160(-)
MSRFSGRLATGRNRHGLDQRGFVGHRQLGACLAAGGGAEALLLPIPAVLAVPIAHLAIECFRRSAVALDWATDPLVLAAPCLLLGGPHHVPRADGLAAFVGDCLAPTALVRATPISLRGSQLRGLPSADLLRYVRVGIFAIYRKRLRRGGRLVVARPTFVFAAPSTLLCWPRRREVRVAEIAVLLLLHRGQALATYTVIVAAPPSLVSRPALSGARATIVLLRRPPRARNRRPGRRYIRWRWRCGRRWLWGWTPAGASGEVEDLAPVFPDAVPELHRSPIPSALARDVYATFGMASPMDLAVVPGVGPLEIACVTIGEKHMCSVLVVVAVHREAKPRVLAPPDAPVTPRDELLARICVEAVRGHEPSSRRLAVHGEALLGVAPPADLAGVHTEREECRVDGGRDGGRWRRRRSNNLPGPCQRHVADDGLVATRPRASLGAARRAVHPSHLLRIAAPIGEDQAHAFAERAGELLQVIAGARPMIKQHLLFALHQQCLEADQGVAFDLERRAHPERSARVDRVAGSDPVCVAHVPRVLCATAAVAAQVVALADRAVALMGRRLEGMGVRFHDVDFRAPLTADHVGVAVVVAPALRRLPIHCASRRRHQVDRKVASAANAAEVHSEAKGRPQQAEGGDMLRVVIRGVARGYHAGKAVVAHHKRASVS